MPAGSGPRSPSPAMRRPSGTQHRTGPPEPGSTGCHRRTPSQASPRPVCQPLEASPPASHPTPSAAGAPNRARPRLPSRTSPLALVRPQPPQGPASASPPIFAAAHPNHRDSAVVPGQTWCQSEREAVRDPSSLGAADRPITTTSGEPRQHPQVQPLLCRLAGLDRADAVGPHHLVVLVLDDVAVPHELARGC